MARKRNRNLWPGLLSELFVNISAGLFLVGVTTIFSENMLWFKVYVLFLNSAAGIFSLILAYLIRKKGLI